MKEVQVDGVKAGYLCGRSGILPDRKTLVLVHGSGGSGQSWLPQLNGLDKDINVVAVDMPGHGATPGGPLDRVEDYARWITSFINAGGFGPCFLLGHSLGGAIAQRVALDRPEILKGIVLVGSGARLKVLPEILENIRNDYDASIRLIVQSCYTKDVSADLIRQSVDITKKVSANHLFGNFSACDKFDVMNEVGNISLPTLIVVGRDDILTPVKYSEFLNKKISGSRLVVLDHAGHCVMHQAITEFNNAVRDFILSVS